ncbi:F-box protein SKIP23-like [Rhododendron vialii]|uniref:F-box protein SKIP23-like n=1 Tax=Rhododendron vialii TaxID=182163 RepID=UPI00265EAC11|nr:F-box protein SKIP23-like [Rhododendron vialii]
MATMENLPKNMAVPTAETPAATDLWYRLPGDILKSIAKRLTDKADAAAAYTNHINALGLLRSVCKSWRSSIEKPSSSSLLSLLPLTLPFPIVPFRKPNSNRGRHFSLTHSILYFLSPLSPTPTAGWLLRVQEPPSRNNNGSKTYHPLNPLSKLEPPERAPRAAAFPESLNLLEVGIAEIGRAHCLKVVDEREKKKQQEVKEKFKRRTMAECQAEYEDAYTTYIKKVAVSLEDYGVVVAIHSGRLCFHKLGGDQKWTLIDSSNDRYHDVVYRKGKYFAVDYRGRTVVIDGADLKKEVMVTRLVKSPLPNLGACQFTRLVDSGNDLFLVDRYLDTEGGQCTLSIGAVAMGMITEESHPPMTNYFNVYKLDEENKQWELVEDLNHQVFFLGDDYLFSVSAQDFPGLKGNCIYFSDCMFRARNEKEANIGKSCVLTGVYNLKDRSCGPLSMFPDHWPIFSPPPAWLKPKHREGMMEGMKEDELQRDVAAFKQDMLEQSPEAKKKAAEAKFRGDDAYRRKDYLVALDAYTQAIDFDPSDATLLSNRSVCWIRLGQAEHALTDANACRALRPDWPKACYREGAALQLLQRFDEAANSFKEGVELDPDSKELANAFREAVEAGKKFHGTNQ